MFNHQQHYVPILKAKQGEYGALANLPSTVRNAITPLLEVPPIDWDYAADMPAKTIDQHLLGIGQKIARAWGPSLSVYVDLLLIPDGELMNDGQHPLSYVFQTLRPFAIEAIPVVGLVRTEGYLEACRSVVEKDNRGACIRVQREDFADFEDIGEAIGRLLDSIEVRAKNADLILDLRSLAADESDLNAERVIGLVDRLPNLGEWRTFTLAATGFPRNLTGLPPSDFSSILRDEWDLWTNLLAVKKLARLPTFGDYAISHPETSEVDPRVIRPSASIRYTCDKYWLVPKGRNLRDYGFKQFYDVCRGLVARPEYSGPQFSWGDNYIDDCAAQRDGPGNLTTWRKVGTSHHLTFVVRQLANAPDS